MTLGPAKHEKVARIRRISNVFSGAKRLGDVCLAPTVAELRLAGAQGAKQSTGIIESKEKTSSRHFYGWRFLLFSQYILILLCSF